MWLYLNAAFILFISPSHWKGNCDSDLRAGIKGMHTSLQNLQTRVTFIICRKQFPVIS